MLKYIYIFIFFALSGPIYAQEIIEEAQPSSIEVDLESEFILAMQDEVLEKYDDAIEKFKNLIKKTPGEGIAEYHIAQILLKQNKTEDALFQAKKAVEKNPSNIYFKELLKNIYEDSKDYKSAADLMLTIIPTHKFDRKEYYELAELYSRANETDLAIEVLEKLDKTAGFDLQTEFYKINILLKAKDYEKAKKNLELLNKKMPRNTEILQKMTMVYRLMNDTKNTDDTYRQILQIDPQNAQALSYFSTQKKSSQSGQNYIVNLIPYLNNAEISVDEKILTLAPYVENISKDDPLLNDLTNAAEILLRLHPHNARTNTLYADLLYNAEQTSKSIVYYNNALKYDKSNFMIWKQLMIIYTMQEDWNKLAKLSTEAIDYYPNHSVVYYYAGRAFINLNQVSKAIEYLDESLLLAMQNEKFRNEILLMKANAYLKDGKSSDASVILDTLDETTKTNHPFYFELRGDIEMMNNNKEKAAGYWKKSLDSGNNSKRLTEKLKNQ